MIIEINPNMVGQCRCTVKIHWNCYDLDVEFSIQPADPDVGIMREGSEEHLLFCPETGARLKELEDNLTERQWEEIAAIVDEQLGDLHDH